MDRESICHDCGRTMKAAFFYCPWCGAAREDGESVSRQIDAVFEEISSLRASWVVSRFERMESELDTLDRALTDLLAETPAP